MFDSGALSVNVCRRALLALPNIKFSNLLPAALRAAHTCRYLVYSEADFDVFAPKGRRVAPIGVKFGMEEGTDPHRCNDKGVGPQKLKFLLRFDRNVE